MKGELHPSKDRFEADVHASCVFFRMSDDSFERIYLFPGVAAS